MTQAPHPHDSVAIRNAATVAVLRDGRQGRLEVLLLRRHHGHVFGAGADVFPGGAVDAADTALAERCRAGCGLPDAAWRMAGLRECFEEAGLLFTATALDAARVAAERIALNAGRRAWADVVDALALDLDLTAPVAFAHWTTPPGPPKRYATRFYALAAPVDQPARADGGETVAADWVAPAVALADADAGRRWLMTPTRATLARLTHYRNTVAALAGLAQGGRDDGAA
ncbi:NUDIX hydrolase [Salinisphaera sp. RV14]|uniref:NUDIX hydrolase n=1 Tax=unclassified Salinisphaera TaxID=2649847 RepID=UPI003F854836